MSNRKNQSDSNTRKKKEKYVYKQVDEEIEKKHEHNLKM